MLISNNSLSIIGLGHIGLPTAALFAKNGLRVIGVDINKKLINTVNQGRSPINEPGLNELVENAVKNGNLVAKDVIDDDLKFSNVFIVIVPTPVDDFKKSDLSAVKSVCEQIYRYLKKDDLVIIESTVPPKTCENIIIPLLEKSGLKAGKDFGVAYTPERAIPNNTLYEMMNNARVIGAVNDKYADLACSLYKLITIGEIIKVENLMTAEMVKLIENTYRDTNIALSNEIAKICEKLDINAIDAINAANYHPRVNIHMPGPGVGGHCLPIDPYFIVEIAENEGIEANLIKSARNVNEGMPEHVVEIIIDTLSEIGIQVKNCNIGLLGVSYKGNVADARETPVKTIINLLIQKGAKIYANDPYTPIEVIDSFGAIPSSISDVLNCQCVVLLTDHDEYKDINPGMILNNVFICTRPILNPDEFRKKGVIFKGIGIS